MVIPVNLVQQPTVNSTEADDLKTQQQILAELKKLRAENAGLSAERDALKGTISVQERIIAIERERGDWFKEAATKGIKAGDSCGLITEKYERMVAQYETEEQRLRSENDKLRSSRNLRSVIAFGAGAVGGALLRPCN